MARRAGDYSPKGTSFTVKTSSSKNSEQSEDTQKQIAAGYAGYGRVKTSTGITQYVDSKGRVVGQIVKTPGGETIVQIKEPNKQSTATTTTASAENKVYSTVIPGRGVITGNKEYVDRETAKYQRNTDVMNRGIERFNYFSNLRGKILRREAETSIETPTGRVTTPFAATAPKLLLNNNLLISSTIKKNTYKEKKRMPLFGTTTTTTYTREEGYSGKIPESRNPVIRKLSGQTTAYEPQPYGEYGQTITQTEIGPTAKTGYGLRVEQQRNKLSAQITERNRQESERIKKSTWKTNVPDSILRVGLQGTEKAGEKLIAWGTKEETTKRSATTPIPFVARSVGGFLAEGARETREKPFTTGVQATALIGATAITGGGAAFARTTALGLAGIKGTRIAGMGYTPELRGIRSEEGFAEKVGSFNYAGRGVLFSLANPFTKKGRQERITRFNDYITLNSFKQTAREAFQKEGYSGAELDRRVSAAVAERRTQQAQQLPMVLMSEGYGNIVGRWAIPVVNKNLIRYSARYRAATPLTRRVVSGGLGVGVGGFAEGASASVGTDLIMRRKVSVSKAVAWGGVGAFMAGGAGAAWSYGRYKVPVTTLDKLKKSTANIGTSLLDQPQEAIGDLGTVAIDRSLLRASQRTPHVAAFGFSPGTTTKTRTQQPINIKSSIVSSTSTKKGASTKTYSFSQVLTRSKQNVKAFGTKTVVLSPSKTTVNVPATAESKERTPSRPSRALTRSFNNMIVPSQSKVPSITPTKINTPVPIKIEVPSKIETKVLTRVESRTDVRTRVNVPVNVPVVVPTGNVPPLAGIRGGGSGQGFRKFFRQAKKYTPSAYAVAFKIKGKMPSMGAIKSGLGVRPIIQKSKVKIRLKGFKIARKKR